MQERNRGTIASRSFTVDDLNITRNNQRGFLIKKFAEDYLQQPDKNVHVERFCKSVTNPSGNFKNTIIYNTSSSPDYRFMETTVIHAITHHRPR